MGGGSARANDVKPNVPSMYQAHLRVMSDGAEKVSLKTPLPENFMLSLGTSWDNPFNEPVSNFASASAGGAQGQALQLAGTGVTAATGFTTLNKWLSAAVWTGGSMLKLDLPFVLQAYADPKKEVVEKMRELMKLVAPSEYAGQFLKAPGPYVKIPGQGVSGDEITVSIGNFFTMGPCIIDNVTETFDTQLDKNGDPIGVTINVSVISYFTTTKEDLDKFFAPSLG